MWLTTFMDARQRSAFLVQSPVDGMTITFPKGLWWLLTHYCQTKVSPMRLRKLANCWTSLCFMVSILSTNMRCSSTTLTVHQVYFTTCRIWSAIPEPSDASNVGGKQLDINSQPLKATCAWRSRTTWGWRRCFFVFFVDHSEKTHTHYLAYLLIFCKCVECLQIYVAVV